MTAFVVSCIAIGWLVLMVLYFVRPAQPARTGAGTNGRESVLPQFAAARTMLQDGGATLPMVSTALGDAATLFVQQVDQETVSARMVLWKPSETEGTPRAQDKQLTLCMFQGSKIEKQMIDDALALAKVKLDKLGTEGTTVKDVAPAISETSPPVIPGAPTDLTADPTVKLRRIPAVFRGEILEMGKLKRTRGESTFDMYGVRLRFEDGTEAVEPLWGDNLRKGLRAISAKVGDHVEIAKLGRRTVEENRPPMALYQVTKLPCAVE